MSSPTRNPTTPAHSPATSKQLSIAENTDPRNGKSRCALQPPESTRGVLISGRSERDHRRHPSAHSIAALDTARNDRHILCTRRLVYTPVLPHRELRQFAVPDQGDIPVVQDPQSEDRIDGQFSRQVALHALTP
jgi:hypothetical protein